jgi:hypothetical protein
MNRCRNCGVLNHLTQRCPRFGPWYPEPGKSKADYAELAAQIEALVAADILAEHMDGQEEEVIISRTSKLHPRELAAQELECDRCGAQPGEPCFSRNGKASKRSHHSRYSRLETDVAVPGVGV